MKSGQVIVITSKDFSFEDQTAARSLHGADSEHTKISFWKSPPEPIKEPEMVLPCLTISTLENYQLKSMRNCLAVGI